jgi:hypothetical protein
MPIMQPMEMPITAPKVLAPARHAVPLSQLRTTARAHAVQVGVPIEAMGAALQARISGSACAQRPNGR